MTGSELFRLIFVPVFIAALAAVVGQYVSARWTSRQKRRDSTRAAVEEFYRIYGEFFAVWKLWHNTKINETEVEHENRRWGALDRITTAEARLEALIVKVTSEVCLDTMEREVLGEFRQGFQLLRESIRDRRALDWRGAEDPEYMAFKARASLVGRTIAASDGKRAPTARQAWMTLRDVTASRHKDAWSSPQIPDQLNES